MMDRVNAHPGAPLSHPQGLEETAPGTPLAEADGGLA